MHVGTESTASRQVQAHVHAEPGSVGHWIDEPPEGAGTVELKVVPLGRIQWRDGFSGEPIDVSGHRLSTEARAVHQRIALQSHCVDAARLDAQPVTTDRRADEGRAEGNHRAALLRLALQREHIRVGIDNPRRRRQERARASHHRLQLPCLIGCQVLEIIHAVAPCTFPELRQCRKLRSVSGDNQLADARMGNTVLFTESVQRVLSLHAETRLETVFLVVDPGMDDAGVARADAGADVSLGFQHHDLASPGRERAGHRQPHDAGTDDDALNALHGLARNSVPRLQPRPMKGISVAMMVMNCTLASRERLAM